MKPGDTFSIHNTTKKRSPASELFLIEIKNFVLGEKYELSLVLVGRQKSKKLNFKYRGKDKPANVLSFALEKNAGEIFIDLSLTETRFEKFALSKKDFFLKLFIHALCHLKGMRHSSKMDRTEAKIQKNFGLKL